MTRHVFLAGRAAAQAPRYTSYPTAMEFSPAVGAPAQAEALAGMTARGRASLYLHIPYCHELCWYCGCNTGALGRPERLGLYVTALVREIATVGAAYQGHISGVHFGGGSPNALSQAQFARIAEAIRAAFRVEGDADWAAELDPRHLDADYARAMAAIGINRVSLGAQTFSLPIQLRINRIQPYRDVAERVAELRAAGIARINLDLMYGLPGQALDDIAATVARAVALQPDRIAMFGYAHLPQALARQRMIDSAALPGAEARFWQAALAHDVLTEGEYEAVGFDHFARCTDSLAVAARGGTLRRNFQGFTDDPAEAVIGLGASAISQFPGLLVQNEKHVGAWRMRAANGQLSGVRGVRREAEDRMRAEVIEQMLCAGSVDLAAVAARHGFDPRVLAAGLDAVDALAVDGIVVRHGWRVKVTPIGRPYARLAAAAFDTHRGGAAKVASRAV